MFYYIEVHLLAHIQHFYMFLWWNMSIRATHQSETFTHFCTHVNKGLYLSFYAMVCKVLGTINKETNKCRETCAFLCLVQSSGENYNTGKESRLL
jgi:hypothetical protein